jgi:hypothetical protein
LSWSAITNGAENFGNFVGSALETVLEILSDPDSYAIVCGFLLLVATHRQPLMVRLFFTAAGYIIGWALGAAIVVSARWARDSCERYPAPWVLLGLVALFYWLP